MAAAKPNENDEVERTQTAKAKKTRLRLMKERNENYLAEQRDENDTDDELTRESKSRPNDASLPLPEISSRAILPGA